MRKSPAESLIEIAHGHIAARCLHLIADFGVADALGDRAATAEELAARTGLNADALARILRLLAAHGVFAAGENGYMHTEMSRLLLSEGPESRRAYVRMIGMPMTWRGFTDLAQTARTGAPAADWASHLAYFADHPEEANVFNEAMIGKSLAIVPAIVASYDFTRFGTVADIGGGSGYFLRAILERAPETRGILFELPHVIADARLTASGRIELVAGDFFEDALPVADAYLLMEVLHDWNDSDAARILAAVRRAAHTGARVLIFESLVSEASGPDFSKMLDIIMLAVTGGRERTRAAYAELLARSGLRLERVIATPTRYQIVEALAI